MMKYFPSLLKLVFGTHTSHNIHILYLFLTYVIYIIPIVQLNSDFFAGTKIRWYMQKYQALLLGTSLYKFVFKLGTDFAGEYGK